MSVLVVGGDRGGVYREQLQALGYPVVAHWSGRNGSDCHRKIPDGTRLVVVLIGYVNHGLARKVRRLAKEMAVEIVFSRSISGLVPAPESVAVRERVGAERVS